MSAFEDLKPKGSHSPPCMDTGLADISDTKQPFARCHAKPALEWQRSMSGSNQHVESD